MRTFSSHMSLKSLPEDAGPVRVHVSGDYYATEYIAACIVSVKRARKHRSGPIPVRGQSPRYGPDWKNFARCRT